MKPLHTVLALLLILFTSSYLQAAMAGSAFCGSKCKVRCSKASVQDRCLKYCGLCCEQCRCVPSGTYGHKDECPCYRDMYTGSGRRRRPKCP
ncbi:peamaclein-like [Canna indica]|uniref:Peamaclein-like n=1 Tax=Canna indica TaxID=4628 RepID=A0AAQ3K6C9_9LILI|nr:peamaclein-like [Canna indica]